MDVLLIKPSSDLFVMGITGGGGGGMHVCTTNHFTESRSLLALKEFLQTCNSHLSCFEWTD